VRNPPAEMAAEDRPCQDRRVARGAIWDYWPRTRSGNRVTVKGERPM